jgi:DNA-binding transcriptional MerR regulator
MSEGLSIGELAARTGVPPSTLRYYDRIGLVRAPHRSGGQRRYPPKSVRRVQAILLCQRSGFSLDEISKLLDGEGAWHRLASTKAQPDPGSDRRT